MKTQPFAWFLPLCVSILVSCASREAPQPQIARSDDAQGDYESRMPPPAEPAPGYPGAQPSPHRSASEAAEERGPHDADEAPQSQRRPGLATQWGEERESRVYEVSFERQSPSRPASVISLQYDDETGIETMTGRSVDDAYPRTFPVRGGAIVVSVTDDDGDPLPTLHAQGRDYVVGDHGDRYQIQVTNHTAGRFEIVASVDGLDVLDGQDGSLSKRGYLIDPWGTLTIDGFRDSRSTVRAFRFGDVETSYAARRGKGRNIGVIGVAVFEERGFRFGYDDDEVYRRRTAEPFPSRFAPPPH